MKYGLIGEKLGHSFSKEIHEMIGYYKYEIHEVAKEDIESFMKEKDFLGINVTIPYKETVIPYLDEISPQALSIGAVNTIVNVNGKLYGHNTDFAREALPVKAILDICELVGAKLELENRDKDTNFLALFNETISRDQGGVLEVIEDAVNMIQNT